MDLRGTVSGATTGVWVAVADGKGISWPHGVVRRGQNVPCANGYVLSKGRAPMAKPYRITAFVRFNNMMMAAFVRLGLPSGSFVLLRVRGRRTGRFIETPVAVFTHAGTRYLIATYGEVNWVRNLRAANGVAALRQGRTVESIRGVELPPTEAAGILREGLRTGPPGIPTPIIRLYRRYFVLPYLNVDSDSSPDAFVREARTHPVFRIGDGRERIGATARGDV